MRPVARVIHADARPTRDTERAAHGGLLEPQAVAAEVRGVQAAIDVHCPAEKTGPPARPVEMRDRLESAQQDCVRRAFRARDDVQAVPETVDQVHVRMARRAVHDARARRQAPRRVRREVARTLVSLGLDDSADAQQLAVPVHEVRPD
jgi:hypothetical protein